MAPESDADGESLARSYYAALDAGDYDRLESLLAPEFVHERPDRTLDGRDAFVSFMRSGRPSTDTTHPIDGVYAETDGDGVAVRGRLCRADGSVITAFVDVFAVGRNRLNALETFTP
jgi:ketosteroid isomerase-like protein